MTRSRGHTRSRAAIVAAVTALVLTGCDDAQDAPGAGEAPGTDADGAAADRDGDEDGGAPEDVDEGAGAQEPALPDVTFIAVAEVDDEAAPESLDGLIASAAGELPADWLVAVVADPALGPYLLGLPDGATVWRVGDDLDPLRAAVTDDAWLAYWDPILTDAGEVADTSSLRAAVALGPAVADAELHVTLTATPRQDLPVEDAETLAASFAETFAQQGLTVEEVATRPVGDGEVAALTLTTPADEFDDGVPRRLQQWFHPEADGPVLWSVTCEGPLPAAATVDEVCPAVLASFRTPPR